MVKKAKNDEAKIKKWNWVALVVCGLCLLGAVIAGGIWITQMLAYKQAQEQYTQLADNTDLSQEVPVATESEMAATEENESSEVETEPLVSDPIEKLREQGVPIPDKQIDFADLQANTNSDIYAWIYIPDSQIDYPILQHPTDNYYYLNYNLDGSKGYPGCIYTEDYNTKDFSDPNTVIYGHNMKNGSMFAGLHNYEDIEYFEANPYVYIYTQDELLVYELFAAYEHSNEHLLYNHDFTDKVVYRIYLDGIYGMRTMNCNIREDVEVTTEDKIITLSTCIATKPDNRYLVQGVLLNED